MSQSSQSFNKKLSKIRQRRVFRLRKIKSSRGCERCGYNESPLALDFAHINPEEKHIAMVLRTGANGMCRLYSRICIKDKEKNRFYIKELFNEIRKCKILCKNCHVIETDENGEFNGLKIREKRGGSYKVRAGIELPKEKYKTLEAFF